jgi:glycosyltransferase involved in cell wall biosynthesis
MGQIVTRAPARPRVLVLARSYPNNVFDLLGLWVRQLVVGSVEFCEPKVVSPVPWCPPLPQLPAYYASYRRVEARRRDEGVEVLHPRFLVGPGLSLRNAEAAFYYAAVRGEVARLRRTFPFDLIHAQFTYPDGVVGALLARKYGVPLVITEQAPWGESLDDAPLVRRQALWAAGESAVHVGLSRSVKESIERYTGPSDRLRVIPNAVDGSVFTLPQNGTHRDRRQILFTGVIRPVKGVDVLLRAMRLLADRENDARLVLVGDAFYAEYRREEQRLRALTGELGLQDHVEFRGSQRPPALVTTMQKSAVLVLPSRAESFGTVLVEALACGTPVVATRCGGPEDIVDERVGVLVPPEDPHALAAGIQKVLDHRDAFDPVTLRAHALDRFGLESVTARYAEVYEEALGRR